MIESELPDAIVVFDTETTGIDVFNDRIVTAFLGLMTRDGEIIEKSEFLINPGIDIPEGASAVHGISTEHAKKHGAEPKIALAAIREALFSYDKRYPLVAYNCPFDFTLLDSELVRHGLESLREELAERKVIDPLVIDKQVDKYRKGSRKLVDTAAHYKVPVEENAHDAGADCLMTGRIAWKLLRLSPLSVSVLHSRQVAWKAVQADGLQKYLRRAKDPKAVVNGGWPLYAKE